MTLLIIQTAKLGDMVCTTPMFRAVKQQHPTAKLLVMSNALNRELLAGNPHIDEYILLPRTSVEIRSIVRIKKVDAAICTSPNPGIVWQLLRARVKKIIVPRIRGGFSPYATKTYRLLTLFATPVDVYFGQYIPRQYLKLLEPLGVYAEDTKKELYASTEAREKAKQLLPEGKKYIGIAPGVGNKIKSWGGKNFAAVANELGKQKGARIVLLGGPADREEIAHMRLALAPGVESIDLANKLSLEELKAVVARLALFVAVDTGPIYIAEAFNVPTVDIIGPMDEREQPPQGPMHRLIFDRSRRAPALHIMNAAMYDKQEARRQVENIQPQEVIGVAQELLKAVIG